MKKRTLELRIELLEVRSEWARRTIIQLRSKIKNLERGVTITTPATSTTQEGAPKPEFEPFDPSKVNAALDKLDADMNATVAPGPSYEDDEENIRL